jgi:hypothetical protein
MMLNSVKAEVSSMSRVIRTALARVLVAAAAITLAPLASAQGWQPNERQVSAERELIDAEISQSRGQFAWVDTLGNLWLGRVDASTGLFDPPDGRGVLVDPEALSYFDFTITFNGPEWVSAAGGDQIAYTKFVAGQPREPRNARLAVAKPVRGGRWAVSVLSPNAGRFAPYASQTDNDPSPFITYVDPAGVHYWRGTGRVNTERRIAPAPPSNVPIRAVRGARSVMLSLEASGFRQVHEYDIDTGAMRQLTGDAGDKAGSFMWRAPEFGNEFVLGTVVDATLRIYRQLPAAGAPPLWTAVNVLQPPPGMEIYSPEVFTFGGRSYVALALGSIANDFPSEIWIASVDPARPEFRRISADQPLRVRSDPEIFITGSGPRIDYNRSALQGTTTPKKCFSIECSEGVWMSDPGLR